VRHSTAMIPYRPAQVQGGNTRLHGYSFLIARRVARREGRRGL